MDAFLRVCGGERIIQAVQNPLGEPVQAAYRNFTQRFRGYRDGFGGGAADDCRNGRILIASTYGVGQLLLHAEARGVKQVILGLGGSATNDCGIGMASALGYAFSMLRAAKSNHWQRAWVRLRGFSRPRENQCSPLSPPATWITRSMARTERPTPTARRRAQPPGRRSSTRGSSTWRV